MAQDEVFEVGYPGAAGPVGFRFASRDGLDFIANRIRRDGLAAYEAPTPGLIAGLVRETAGAFLDVGANTGIFALLAAAANPAIQVFAFEPNGRVHDALSANLALNPALQGRIRAERLALSRQAGELSFFETVNDQGFLATSSSMEQAHASTIDHGVYDERIVPATTLDLWAENRLGGLGIGLIKIDVESHEHAVIEGGRATIARLRPPIIMEVLPRAELAPVERMIAEENYLDFAVAPDALRQETRLRYHLDADNHLLCPAEQVGRVSALARQHGLAVELA